MIRSFDYPRHLITIALLVSDKAYYHELLEALCGNETVSRYGFRQVTVIHRSIDAPGLSAAEDRHSEELHGDRRRLLARLRNFLVYTALQQEEGVLWLDADVVKIPLGALKKVIGKRCFQSLGYFDMSTVFSF